MEKETDLILQYKVVTNKIKKKFLKKPNLVEGSEQFESLGKQQREDENSHHAGLCFLAQARCEQSLGNWTLEAKALLKAGRCFMEAEEKFESVSCVSLREDLHSAINCFSHAIRVYLENGENVVGASISMEIACKLIKFNRQSESIQHLSRAVDLLKPHPIQCMEAMSHLIQSFIIIGDYENGLITCSNMFSLASHCSSSFSNLQIFKFLKESEINSILLLLLLRPQSSKTTPEQIILLKKYSTFKDEEEEEEEEKKDYKNIKEKLNYHQSDIGKIIEIDDNMDKSNNLDNKKNETNNNDNNNIFNNTSTNNLKENKKYLGLDLFLCLQSFVISCQAKNLRDIEISQTQLLPFLSRDQKQLLKLVVDEYYNEMVDLSKFYLASD